MLVLVYVVSKCLRYEARAHFLTRIDTSYNTTANGEHVCCLPGKSAQLGQVDSISTINVFACNNHRQVRHLDIIESMAAAAANGRGIGGGPVRLHEI